MVKLFCAVVGVAGSAFEVDIDEGASVSALKKAIKAENKNTIKDDAKDLQLFLAKKGNAWLPSTDLASIQAGIPVSLQRVPLTDATWSIQDVLTEYELPDPQTKQIHVLVVVPGIMTTIEVNESQDESEELAYYQRLGQEIQTNCQQHCGAILDKIDTIYEKGPYPKPFICVEGSSGMGKSQLAFALGGEGRQRPRPWFYWPLASSEVGKQRVYKNFSSIAKAFDSVVKKDELDDRTEEDILGCDSSVYTTKKLWTYGFIIELLRYCSCENKGAQMVRIENETFKVTKSDQKAVIEAVRSQMKTDGKVLPFFILDEMTPTGKNPEMKKKAAFQRNVFRACGLVVIVMGTDAKITNLVSQSLHSRSDPHWWMTVVSSFPLYQSIPFLDPAKKEAWQKVIISHEVVKHIAEHSRGLFSRYFVDAVVQFALRKDEKNETFELADLLDAAFEAVSKKAQVAKAFMNTSQGRDAQLMALSYTHASSKRPDFKILVAGGDGTSEPPLKRMKVAVESMQLHFANLEDEVISDVDVSWGSLLYRDTQNAWSPTCHFPVIEKDVLLYLAVLGGKQSAYYNYRIEKEYSTVGVFEEFRRRNGNRAHVNTNALSSDGSELENMAAHALFCASRRNGVRGIAFNEFFSALIGEFQAKLFQPKPINARALLEGYAGLAEKFADTKIPFLAPPNAEWPVYILEAGGACKFGHLVRAQNADRLDCYVMVPEDDNPLFVCECKNWGNKLDSGAMDGIITGLNAEYSGRAGKDSQRKRKWNNWDLALVFCQKLTQFQQKKIDGWKLSGTGMVTVDCKTGVVNWMAEPEAREKLVIVLLTGSVLSDEVSGVVE
ncbi:hypothetical protein V7S43_019077 [Phytophthora oleae]|uniref:Crinkler effector protein N-terminal domain-containing protein n=1 Tax=Phytophthora oleae TaxID=2107226 RepID=A0ABD3G4Z2_9STRA